MLNMADDLRNRGGKLNLAALSAELGAPVALVSARAGEGIEQVHEFLAGVMPKPAPEDAAGAAGRAEVPRLGGPGERAGRLPRADSTEVDAPPGFGFSAPDRGTGGLRAGGDRGIPDDLQRGGPVMDGVEACSHVSGQRVGSLLPDSLFRSLLIDGVWNGVGSVIVFLPQMLLLFLFIGILEDSGYLARAALIADRTMARVGLQGKSFIPLLSAYACAVPAIMSTRTIENKRDRIATILIAPFMTCSARLPVYALVIAAFIPE